MPKKTILYIEDEASLRMAVSEFLSMDLDAEVIAFADHTKADAWLEQNPGQCDLVITDNEVGTKEMTGIDWIPTFAKRYPAVPVILHYAGKKEKSDGLVLKGMLSEEDVIFKPCPVIDIVKRAEHLLEYGKGKHVDEALRGGASGAVQR